MKFRPLLTLLLSSVLALSAIVFTNLPSARASVLSEASYSDQKVVGLAIKYRQGVVPVNIFGEQVGIDLANGKLLKGLDVGLGVWSAPFPKALKEDQAKQVAALLVNDPRIEAVYLDHMLSMEKLNMVGPRLAVLKASSVPTGLSLKDAWTISAPTKAKVKLTWKAPTKLNGGYIWGYRISKFDSVTGKYVDLVSNTKSKTTSITVTSGLVPGITSKFRVAAVTKTADSRYMAVSPYSITASIKLTTAPKAPVLQSPGVVTSSSPTVTWLEQSNSDKGGLATTYSVTGTTTDNLTASCNTTANSCMLSGLVGGKKYTVRVTATNAKGSSVSDVVAEAQDPMLDQQWYLDSAYGMNVSDAWAITKGSPSVVVAVVDTGITSHPDLNENVIPGYDLISSASNARDGDGRDSDATDPGDYNLAKDIPSSWHGTHVAGIIAAVSNSIGISGIAPNVKVQPIRVLGINGGSETDIAAGINYAIGVPISGVPTNRNLAKVINLSIGSSAVTTCSKYSPTQLAIDASRARNVTLVTAAGNDNRYAASSYPGNCFGNITIGATGITGDRSWYSNYSYPVRDSYNAIVGYIGVDISAPGGDERDAGAPAGGMIISTMNSGETVLGSPTYIAEEGTSMASPMAAGVVALMYSVEPTITDDQVWEILSSTTKDFPVTSDCSSIMVTSANYGTTGLCGVGIIDAGAAVLAASRLK
jgi:serine protease